MSAATHHFDALLAAALDDRQRTHLLRQVQTLRPLDAVHVECDGIRAVNFSSNNYLGLTHHPRVLDAVTRATKVCGAGSAASPLITGHTEQHAQAEHALARWKGTESSLLLPSGYQANHAAVQAIAGTAQARGAPVRFLLDKLAHASLIDAVRATGMPMRVFGHNDLARLSRLLRKADPKHLQVVVTESIFSMDGDAAPLAGLAELKRDHSFLLLLDEAHGSGVYGAGGAGLAAELELADSVDVFVVTLSKALGGVGGAVCASKRFCAAIANFGRAFVYSTAVPASAAAACVAAIEVMRDEPQRQRRVRELARHVRQAFGLEGDSPIVPIVLRDESAALAAAEKLRKEGFLVLPVRPPTVPRGTSRLRLTLSCEHSNDEVDRLIEMLRYAIG